MTQDEKYIGKFFEFKRGVLMGTQYSEIPDEPEEPEVPPNISIIDVDMNESAGTLYFRVKVINSAFNGFVIMKTVNATINTRQKRANFFPNYGFLFVPNTIGGEAEKNEAISLAVGLHSFSMSIFDYGSPNSESVSIAAYMAFGLTSSYSAQITEAVCYYTKDAILPPEN